MILFVDGLEAASAPLHVFEGRDVFAQFLALSVVGGESEVGRVGRGIVVFPERQASGLFEGGQLRVEQRLAAVTHSDVTIDNKCYS